MVRALLVMTGFALCLAGCHEEPRACAPEDDFAFCARFKRTCGALTNLDTCGAVRSVESCGPCGPPKELAEVSQRRR